MLTRLAISGYRSLRDLRLSLSPLTIVTGANGSGKSSLYRALRLLADVARGRAVQSLASEGGLQSTLWAGPESFSREVKAGVYPMQGLSRKNPIALKLGFSGPLYGFAIELGLPVPSSSAFSRDPQIKIESLWTGELLGRGNLFAERRGPGVRIKDNDGAWRQAMSSLDSFDTMMTHCADPRDGLELLRLRETMRDWRFYDYFRTDREAPARRPRIGTYTPVLSSDGGDLAAAVQTIEEIGDAAALENSVSDAFPRSKLDVVQSDGYFELEMRQHGLLRPLRAAELSDGTLRYLLLIAALLTPRPPTVMILNEPEASLHPDLLPPLARLVAAAATRTQIILVSHSPALVAMCLQAPEAREIRLEKQFGETLAPEASAPKWIWPAR